MITVFVIPHTHWDREWYEPAARFRQRLLPVVDEVLDVLQRDPEFSCFLLDGQAAILDDYLELRPERRSLIAELAGAGRLLVGPWYVLSDELLSSDECLVRNLLKGRSVAGSVGGWLPMGYSPDAFGHPAALPTILSGFGIEHGILWRGYGGEEGQGTDLFRWSGPDGSAVTFHHLPPSGYEFGSGFPRTPDKLAAHWAKLDEVLGPRAGGAVRLLTAGADHHAIDAELPGLLKALGGLARDHEFRIASPLEYFAALPHATVRAEKGELRFSYRYTWTLQGVHSTRSRMKRVVAEGDRLLIRWAEPQLALAKGADRGPLLAAAWRDHLLNHPHDSLGGCVTDEVASDVTHRAQGVVTQARGLLIDALHERLGQDRVVVRRGRERWTPSLVIVNPRASAASGVVEATVTVFQADIPVGPDSATRRPTVIPTVAAPQLIGPGGKVIPTQVLDAYDAYERLDSPSDYPDQDRVRAFRLALLASDVPALGLQRLDVASVPAQPAVVPDPVHPPIGLLALADLESDRDDGDTYTFQPMDGDVPVRARWSRPRVVWPGPLVAAVARDAVVGNRARATVTIRVDSGSRLVRFAVDGMNTAGNHRLRIRFPLPPGTDVSRSVADMQFGSVAREKRSHDRREFLREWPVTTAPMHRFVSVGNGSPGLTVFSRGNFEYELDRDGILVTLLRCVGDLSRDDLAARPGNAGWPVSTPEAQELGRFRAELAVAPLGVTEASPSEEWDVVERLAEEFHSPLAGLMLRYGIDVPKSVVGPELVGAGLAFKTLKRAEQGDGIVARCVNLTGKVVPGRWKWPKPLKRAVLARLDEKEIGEIPLSKDSSEISVEAPPRGVVTIVVYE